MTTLKKQNLIGQSLLFLATVIWGSSFIVLKNTISILPPVFVIALRFMICGLITFFIFFKKIIKINKQVLLRGIILGLTLGGAYLTQTLGLKETTPSQNAFITSSYCVMCPFLAWMFLKKKPKGYHIFSAVLCAIGIAFVGANSIINETESGSNVILGDVLTLISAVFYASQIIVIEKNKELKADGGVMLVLELLTVGVLLSVYSALVEIPTYGIESFAIDKDQLFNIMYLTLVCTLVAQGLLIVGQGLSTSANQSAIILSLEAVFGTIFSMILGNEKLSPILIIGFVIIFIAMIMCELEIDIFKKRKNT